MSMDYVDTGGTRISRLTLGTAQLGMDYGISNRTGMPEPEIAMQILHTAAREGINCLDTAPAYGCSQSLIGDFGWDGHIVTKIPKLTGPDYQAEIMNSLKRSLAQMRVSRVSFCLLHSASDMNSEDGEPASILAGLKEDGIISHAGASVYTPGDVRRFLDLEILDTIQVPINIIDHRLLDTGLLEELAEAGVIVFARSVFLQGLLLMEPGELPGHMAGAVPYLKELEEISREENIPVKEMAMAFVRDLPGVSSIVVGVESVAHLEGNIKLMSAPTLSSRVRDRLSDAFRAVPEHVLDPSQWEKQE